MAQATYRVRQYTWNFWFDQPPAETGDSFNLRDYDTAASPHNPAYEVTVWRIASRGYPILDRGLFRSRDEAEAFGEQRIAVSGDEPPFVSR